MPIDCRLPQVHLGRRPPAAALAGPDADVLGLLAVPDGDGAALLPGAAAAAAGYGLDWAAEARRHRFTGAVGTSAVLRLPDLPAAPWAGLPGTVVLLGTGGGAAGARAAAGTGGAAGTHGDGGRAGDGRDGDAADGDGEGPGATDAARQAGLALGRAAAGTAAAAVVVEPGTDAAQVRALVEGFLLAGYRMPRTSSRPDPGPAPAERLTLLVAGPADGAGPAAPAGDDAAPGYAAAVTAARAAVRATLRTRLLAATPPNTKSPAWLADQARALAAETRPPAGRLSAEVHDEAWLAEQGMGGILAVGSGSATPPRLVVVTWEPPHAARTVALVGKGITFDTGGLSLKPREAMVTMKTDMAGAAAVLAATLGAAELALPVRVVAVLPLAENAIGGAAYRPGDVVRTFDGTTVEIANTDAEGRMVLADALAWAGATLDPDVLVDVATLTGAAKQGLGLGRAALYATDDDLAGALLRAGREAGEPAWRMPLVTDYVPALDSTVADVGHVTSDPHVGAGSVLAALFLARFAAGRTWAHLDIAGPGRTGSKQGELPAGAPTGYGAHLLLRYLEAVGGQPA
ncbi:M17 family metallopeptidase [Georgenia sp. TF02-10]|uniref:leucyl aminopeptidase family protein n=1 Tax=Georgenia sp. TF02-10 TaxID=2917725 RepID=UPI001FA73E29|nr:M17 family metallopeptidase [Georgenia sp. TF02-10]UNX54185.1 M17 family metallopeptidase [Georgenia sp. TF02-10]